jgi:hypothetical protein
MTTFDVGSSGRRSPHRGRPAQARGSYAVHPLPALGGVFAYVQRGGEGIGLYFGKSELAVTAAVAEGVLADSFDTDTGANA